LVQLLAEEEGMLGLVVKDLPRLVVRNDALGSHRYR
jgi:hypothetical protein